MTVRIKLKLALFTFLAAGGCAQILGISDYEVDPTLDPDSGQGGSNQGGSDSEGGSDSAGKSGSGGKAGSGSQGGEPGQGGESGQGGSSPQAGAAGQVGSGAGGEGGAPPVLGALIPCSTADCCEQANGQAVGLELLEDGGFEAVPQTFWTETSSEGFDLIMTGVEANVPAQAGTRLAFLAGIELETSDVETPPLDIPSDAGWFELNGYRWFELDSLAVANTDFAGIGFYSYTTTNPIELPFFWDTSDDPGETVSWTAFSASWSATAHAGESRYLLVRAAADDFADDPVDFPASNYLFDSLSLKMFRCYEP